MPDLAGFRQSRVGGTAPKEPKIIYSRPRYDERVRRRPAASPRAPRQGWEGVKKCRSGAALGTLAGKERTYPYGVIRIIRFFHTFCALPWAQEEVRAKIGRKGREAVKESIFSLRLRASGMKIAVPKAPWTAVAAATAFRLRFMRKGTAVVASTALRFRFMRKGARKKGGSCRDRSPRRCAHFHLPWRAPGSWESVVATTFFTPSEPFRGARGEARRRTVIVRYFGKLCLAPPRNLIFLLDEA